MTATTKSRGLLPDYCFSRVTEISVDWLRGLSINGLLLDIDNTITRWEQRRVPKPELAWLQALSDSGLRLRLLSNGLAVKRSEVERQTGIPLVGGSPIKPFAMAFRRALKDLDLPAAQVMMIGDSVVTDALGANRLGIWSCLVEPLSPVDFPGSKLHRMLERLFHLRRPLHPENDLRH